jgi:hypothetical protein
MKRRSSNFTPPHSGQRVPFALGAPRPAATDFSRWVKKSSLAILLLALPVGCTSKPTDVHPLDGKSIVLEGHWNALAKQQGQIVCATEPKVVDVLDVGHLATPKHQQLVRITAVLHWRGMDPQERQRFAAQAVQLYPDGYIIRWPEARWEPVDSAHPPPRQATAPDLQAFVGKTVADLLDAQHLTLSECRFIDEPPGVLCELSFPTMQLHVALKRQPSLFSEQRQWSPDAVRQAQIVAIQYENR